MKPLGQLLAESLALSKKTFLKLLAMALACFGGVVTFLIAAVILIIIFSIFLTIAGLAGKTIAILVSSVMIVMIIAVFSTIYTIGTIKIIQAGNKEEMVVLNNIFKDSWNMLGPTLLIAAIVVIKVVLWALLLIIPGIIFGIYYSYAYLAFIVDGKKGNEALIFSKSLIKPNIGKFIGNSLAVGLILFVVIFALNWVIGIIFGVADKNHVTLSAQIGGLIDATCNVILGFYGTVFSYLLYEELKKSPSLIQQIPA